MKAIIFLNTTESGTCREALRSAKRLGYKVILFTDSLKQYIEKDRFNEVDLIIYLNNLTFDEVKFSIQEEIINEYEIALIISLMDGYVSLASELADIFCKNLLNTNAIKIMENKYKTREFFKDDLFTPKFKRIENREIELKYPLVYKEPTSTGSKGVRMINSPNEISTFNSYDAFLEEYIPGKQYLIELLVKDGKPYVIAKIEQTLYKTNFNTFIISGYSLNKDFKLNIQEISMINNIISKLKVENAHFHIEYKINKDGVKLVEINPRISGSGMHKILEVALDINYIDILLKFYLGEEIDIPKIKNNCYAHYFLSDKQGVLSKITGRTVTSKLKNIKSIYIKPKRGQYINISKSMANRYGYIIGTGTTKDEAKKYTLAASKNIIFHLSKDSYIYLVLFILLVIIILMYLS